MGSYFLAPLSVQVLPTTHSPFTTRDTPYMVHERAGSATYKFEHVPVEHVVIGEALAMEQIPEKLPQVRVVRLVVKTQGTAEIQICGKFSYKTRNSKLNHETQLRLKVSLPTLLSTSRCCTLKGRRTDAKHLSDF
uniref:Uncharacterized protein n=1 Tax=Nomascus leucogenys TaxID=61853 RepID=A0A2I3HU13_NOMLE